MTKTEAIKWYESLPNDSRSKLQREFDLIYDNLGSRETKFYKWIMSFKKSKQKEYTIKKCWVIRNSEGNILYAHMTMKDEQRKDYRRQGLFIDECLLLD